MIVDGGSKTFSFAKRLLVEDPAMARQVLTLLARAVGEFLIAQVRAGAQVGVEVGKDGLELGELGFGEWCLHEGNGFVDFWIGGWVV